MSRSGTQYRSVFIPALLLALTAQSACASPQASETQAPLASSFPGPLWDVVTPKGGSVSVANAHMTIKVPGGSNHDPLIPANDSVRAMQPIGNEDFDVSIKIDSPIVATDVGTSRGLMVLGNDRNFITFGLGTDGTNISLTAHTLNSGVAATVFNDASFNEYHNPICLRLARAGSAYTAYYSVDGVVWTQATTFTVKDVPTALGPFAGNYNKTPASAVPVVMAINWFDVL